MNTLEYKEFHRRHLPHIHSLGRTFFITYRLANSIPQRVLQQHQQEQHWLEKQQQYLSRTNQHKEVEVAFESFRNKWFLKFEEILDKAAQGEMWLGDESLAKIVADSLHHFDGHSYELDAYCIMSNHVHVILTSNLAFTDLQAVQNNASPLRFVSETPSLSKIMHSLKSFTAKECNQILNRKGAFWAAESFDHIIRKGKFEKTINYVLQNPVKAGLVNDWRDWKWSYRKNVG